MMICQIACLFSFSFEYKCPQVPEGNGSGVVWDEQGHIVTNYHGNNEIANSVRDWL